LPFSHLGLAPEILRGVRAAGYGEPTPIQAQAIPPILAGRDVVGCAQTGTGKTAAFVLPILHHLRRKPAAGGRRMGSGDSVRALIITPTRELAAQVETAVRDYSRFMDLRCTVVYGGVAIGPQETRLRLGVDILVATPGRLIDHMERGNVFFTRLEILVLDEADRMVDMGFAPDLSRILRKLPAGRQTLMFSATIPPELNAMARKALVEPVRIDVAPKVKTAAGIREAVYPVPRQLKTDILLELLENAQMDSVLVFARTKRGAERLARELERSGHPVAALHSNRTQSQRERALAGFRSGRYQVLVATDIASRGLDVDGISHVINYDVPQHPEDYVHRAGRTARASAIGDAFTLMAREEVDFVAAIERFTGKAIPRVILPDFDYKHAAPRRPARVRAARAQSAHPRVEELEEAAGSTPKKADRSFGRGKRKTASTRRRRR